MFFIYNLFAHAISSGRIGVNIENDKIKTIISVATEKIDFLNIDHDEKITLQIMREQDEEIKLFIRNMITIAINDDIQDTSNDRLLLMSNVVVLFRENFKPASIDAVNLVTNNGSWSYVLKHEEKTYFYKINPTNNAVQVDFSANIKISIWLYVFVVLLLLFVVYGILWKKFKSKR